MSKTKKKTISAPETFRLIQKFIYFSLGEPDLLCPFRQQQHKPFEYRRCDKPKRGKGGREGEKEGQRKKERCRKRWIK